MIPWLDAHTPFPDVSDALTINAPGLLAAGADLSPQRLLAAYQQGIFPWYSEGQPILWWSTDPRMVLMTDDFHISDSLKKRLRQVARDPRWEIKFDSAFTTVIRACAAPRRNRPGTWISDQIIDGYTGLHAQGYAHSCELWRDAELVGGCYGVSIGHMFYGESMFARIPDGSKIALAYLVAFLRQHGVPMIDCQQETGHLASLGGKPITRTAFLAHLRTAIALPQISNWAPVAPTL